MTKEKNIFYSPLRYPGGKTALAPLIKQIFYENNLVGSEYLEVYAGGAGVALSLLFEEYVSSIEINDLDRSIYAFWHSVVYENNRFRKAIEKIPVTIPVWHKQQKIQLKKEKADLFTLGVSTFFLNRTNFSGIIKGGVIGGINQNGNYKMDTRFNKTTLLKQIKIIGDHKDRIKVTNNNAVDILDTDLSGKLVYLDPPYVQKSMDLYMNYYQENDHRQIADKLLNNDSKFLWMLSYDKNPLIEEIYSSCKKNNLCNIKYSASHSQGNELIYFHPKLKVKKSLEYQKLQDIQRAKQSRALYTKPTPIVRLAN